MTAKRAQRRWRTALVRRFCIGLAAALLAVATFRGGAEYVFCASMGEVVSHSCCALRASPRDEGAPQLVSGTPCCSVRRVASVLESTPSSRSRSSRAILFAPPPANPAPARSALLVAAPRATAIAPPFERPPTGPPKPSAIARRTRVFLI